VLLATVLAISSAGLHATWNLLIKTSGDRELAAWGQFLAGGLVFVPVLVVAGPPDTDAWPFIAASSVVHVGYVYALVAAYRHGDYSFAYPLARGGGALVAAVLGASVLARDSLSPGAWTALVVVALGLASLVRPGVARAELGYALLTAVVIGCYTVIDAAGARRTGDGFVYACALVVATGITLTVTGVARGRGVDFVGSLAGAWPRYVLTGVLLTAAYGLVLVAVRHAPVGYVATLRESSVVLGALLGWLVLGEALGRRRTISSVVVAAGLAALVATG
jgi:drug/metabolite transporter (DMT)-like permease